MKNPMRSIKTVLILGSLLAASGLSSQIASAEQRLNGRQAADACKQEISALYAENKKIKFSKNPASSVKSGAYTFWINSTEKADGDKSSIRYLCEITRSGELVGLTREEGRWKI